MKLTLAVNNNLQDVTLTISVDKKNLKKISTPHSYFGQTNHAKSQKQKRHES